MKKLIIGIVVIAAIGAGIYFATTSGGNGITMGQDIPEGLEPTTIANALKAGQEGNIEVVLHGTMEEKCPTAGCWFYLTDNTGKIRVDTQFAGFTVINQKIGSKVTVYGKVIKPEGGDPELSALGAKF